MTSHRISENEKQAASQLRWKLLCAGLPVKMYAHVGIYRMPVTCREKLVVFDVDPGVVGDDGEISRRKKRNAWLEAAGVEVIHVYADEVDQVDLDRIRAKVVPNALVAQMTGRLASWADQIQRRGSKKVKARRK